MEGISPCCEASRKYDNSYTLLLALLEPYGWRNVMFLCATIEAGFGSR